MCPGCGVFQLEWEYYTYRQKARPPRPGHAGHREPRTRDKQGRSYRVARCRTCVQAAKRAWIERRGGYAAQRERDRVSSAKPEVRARKSAYARECSKYGSRRERAEWGVTADEMERDRIAAGLVGGDTGPYHAGGGARNRPGRPLDYGAGADSLPGPGPAIPPATG